MIYRYLLLGLLFIPHVLLPQAAYCRYQMLSAGILFCLFYVVGTNLPGALLLVFLMPEAQGGYQTLVSFHF
jgi:hypothetical protein